MRWDNKRRNPQIKVIDEGDQEGLVIEVLKQSEPEKKQTLSDKKLSAWNDTLNAYTHDDVKAALKEYMMHLPVTCKNKAIQIFGVRLIDDDI